MQLFTRESAAPSGDDAAAAFGHPPNDPAEFRLDDGDCMASLRRTIEFEIIPRLMLAHGVPVNDDTAPEAAACDPGEEANRVADLLLRQDVDAARAHVQALRHAGMPIEQIYLQLLAPAARRLGALWEADLCDFTQVTVGLWRLQQIVHEHGTAFQREGAAAPNGRRALLMPAPGSQHTFGLLLVGEFFRRAGWEVSGDPTISLQLASRWIAEESFDLIGMSIGSESHAEAVASAILLLRRVSKNRDVVVTVGGPLVNLDPGIVQRVGADATAPDAAAAVALAERLVARHPTPDR